MRHGGPPAKRELDLSGDGPSADGLDPLLRVRSPLRTHREQLWLLAVAASRAVACGP